MAKKKREELVHFIIFVAVLVVLFVGMVIYGKYKANRQVDKTTYNNYQFYQDLDGFWMTTIQIGETLYPITFYNHPTEVEDVYIGENLEDLILIIRPAEIIIALPSKPNPKLAFAGRQISKVTEGILEISTIPMLNEPEDNISYVNCETDASKSKVILSFVPSNRNRVYAYDENPYCVKLEFNDELSINESLRVADAFSYRLIKII